MAESLGCNLRVDTGQQQCGRIGVAEVVKAEPWSSDLPSKPVERSGHRIGGEWQPIASFEDQPVSGPSFSEQ